jgi:hypothetical protein
MVWDPYQYIIHIIILSIHSVSQKIHRHPISSAPLGLFVLHSEVQIRRPAGAQHERPRCTRCLIRRAASGHANSTTSKSVSKQFRNVRSNGLLLVGAPAGSESLINPSATTSILGKQYSCKKHLTLTFGLRLNSRVYLCTEDMIRINKKTCCWGSSMAGRFLPTRPTRG